MPASLASRNQLLARLSQRDSGLLWPHLEAVELPVRQTLERPNKAIEHAYFIENGIASIVATNGDEDIEAGIVGWEGMSGIPLVMNNDRSTNSVFMQVAGRGLRIKTRALQDAMAQSDTLRLFLLSFVQSFMAQAAQSALANGRATIERRLARWLLMAHDRLDGHELPLTHEFMGMMLAVRRSGVTVALHNLEEAALVRTARSKVVVLNRKGLEKLAGRIYGVAEMEYRRLLGWTPAPKP